MALPDFTPDGLLPPGDYELTLGELARSRLVVGDRTQYPQWAEVWRLRLVQNLGLLVRQLWQVGISDVFIDGSFVEDKEHPNDIDGYFRCEFRQFVSGELERALNELDPGKVWTWDWARRATDVARLSRGAVPAPWTVLGDP